MLSLSSLFTCTYLSWRPSRSLQPGQCSPLWPPMPFLSSINWTWVECSKAQIDKIARIVTKQICLVFSKLKLFSRKPPACSTAGAAPQSSLNVWVHLLCSHNNNFTRVWRHYEHTETIHREDECLLKYNKTLCIVLLVSSYLWNISWQSFQALCFCWSGRPILACKERGSYKRTAECISLNLTCRRDKVWDHYLYRCRRWGLLPDIEI